MTSAAVLDPRAARARARAGSTAPTAGWAPGHAQANLISVPADWAYDVLLFCTRNPKPCPVLDVTDRECRPAGRLHGPMVVSMRHVPAGLVDTARRVTPQAAVTASRPLFAIIHAPGRMLVTDVRDSAYRVAA